MMLSSPRTPGQNEADAIVVGAGLAGLVAAAEIADAGRSVLLVEREGEQSVGGQAYWSFGGLFLIDSPEQRRLGVKDSLALARQDWFGTARFDRPEYHWPRQWAEAYLRFAAGEKRAWLRQMGHRLFPVVGWAERGDGTPDGHGNSVPRFHITLGHGAGHRRAVRAARAPAHGRWPHPPPRAARAHGSDRRGRRRGRRALPGARGR